MKDFLLKLLGRYDYKKHKWLVFNTHRIEERFEYYNEAKLFDTKKEAQRWIKDNVARSNQYHWYIYVLDEAGI